MASDTPDDLIEAAFFFVDIVGLSNPELSTETQRTKIKILNQSIYDCKTFTLTPKNELFILPTGDGMLIGFKNGVEQPLKLSIELHEKLNEYNKKCLSTEQIFVRIGCNVGHIFVVKDVFGNLNLWGPGAILARRVMDLGDKNHIFLTSNMAYDLFEISDDYKKIIHPLHDYKIKHNEEILIYTVFNGNFGNKEPPKKKLIESKKVEEENKTVCEKIKFNISIKESENKIHAKHERIYDFVNNSPHPIYEIFIGILTNTEASPSELHLKVHDEEKNELKISKILAFSPFSKRLTVKLKRPVFKGGDGRRVIFNYEKEEIGKSFEHKFYTDTLNFALNIITTQDFLEKNCKLYLIKNEKNKVLIPIYQVEAKGLSKIISFSITEKINIDDRIRLEWYEPLEKNNLKLKSA